MNIRSLKRTATAWCASAVTLCGLLIGGAADAAVLDFGANGAAPLNACATASGTCTSNARLLPSYGDIAGVIDVRTHASDGGTLRWFDTKYNDLYGVVFDQLNGNATWIDLVPLGDQELTLSHFELGGYLGKRNKVSAKVIDLGSGEVLFSYLGDVGTPAGTGNYGVHTSFDLNLRSLSGLRIQWHDPSWTANVALDNIHYSVASPVSEPASGLLLLAGMGAVGWQIRRRRPD
jgi:hypothetical protein